MDFYVDGADGPVPCTAWLPDDAVEVPVLLVGHGGSGSRRTARHERLGRWFAARGVAVLAIDGPFHGDRAGAPVPASTYQRLIVRRGVEATIAGMVEDWSTALTTLARMSSVDADWCAYLGLSLGSRFGIPLAAELGPALRCAVFGKFGLQQSGALASGLNTPVLIRGAAQRITAPTLFAMRWDDELFPRSGCLDLFDAFAASDKTLIARPGLHAGSHPDDEPMWCEFVMRHIGAVCVEDT